MKIYTKTGDKGETSLFGGKRVLKSDVRIESYGTVDELNAWIGLIKDMNECKSLHPFFITVQDKLFVLGAELAADPDKKTLKTPVLSENDVTFIEKEIDILEQQLEPLRHFVLPGGHTSVSNAHIARCVCRRAERCVVRLHQLEPVDEIIIHYLNRLSDYLFVLSRWLAKETNAIEDKWIPNKV